VFTKASVNTAFLTYCYVCQSLNQQSSVSQTTVQFQKSEPAKSWRKNVQWFSLS